MAYYMGCEYEMRKGEGKTQCRHEPTFKGKHQFIYLFNLIQHGA